MGTTAPQTATSPLPNGGNGVIRTTTRRRHADSQPLMLQNPHRHRRGEHRRDRGLAAAPERSEGRAVAPRKPTGPQATTSATQQHVASDNPKIWGNATRGSDRCALAVFTVSVCATATSSTPPRSPRPRERSGNAKATGHLARGFPSAGPKAVTTDTKPRVGAKASQVGAFRL